MTQYFKFSVVDVKTAIPMVMGANIGTSMTSTLVSLTHIGDPEQVNLKIHCYKTIRIQNYCCSQFYHNSKLVFFNIE